MSCNHLRLVCVSPTVTPCSLSTSCIISGTLTFLQKVSIPFASGELYTIELVSSVPGAPRALQVSIMVENARVLGNWFFAKYDFEATLPVPHTTFSFRAPLLWGTMRNQVLRSFSLSTFKTPRCSSASSCRLNTIYIPLYIYRAVLSLNTYYTYTV
jgi:hypothetical protein